MSSCWVGCLRVLTHQRGDQLPGGNMGGRGPVTALYTAGQRGWRSHPWTRQLTFSEIFFLPFNIYSILKCIHE